MQMNKRAVAIDLHSATGREMAENVIAGDKRLLEECDKICLIFEAFGLADRRRIGTFVSAIGTRGIYRHDARQS